MLWELVRSASEALLTSAHSMFLQRNKKNIGTFWLKKVPYLLLWLRRQSYLMDTYIHKTVIKEEIKREIVLLAISCLFPYLILYISLAVI